MPFEAQFALAVQVELSVGLVIAPVPSFTKTALFVPLPLVQPMVICVACTFEKLIAEAWVVGAEKTVRSKLLLADNPPASVTLTVMVAVPDCPLAGVTVTLRLAALPEKTIFELGTNDVFEDEPVTLRLLVAVSASPIVNASADVLSSTWIL